jgi:hypothetical protein
MMHFTIDAPTMAAIFTGLVAMLTAWNTITLAKVHSLTNNTLTVTTNAKDTATAALAESQATNRALLAQLAIGRRVDDIHAITVAAQTEPARTVTATTAPADVKGVIEGTIT